MKGLNDRMSRRDAFCTMKEVVDRVRILFEADTLFYFLFRKRGKVSFHI
jgi:hypothetical protein